MIKARPTSRGMYSGLDHTRVVQTLVQTFGLCTRVWTDTRVDSSPCTPLLVGLVYFPSATVTHCLEASLRQARLYIWECPSLSDRGGQRGGGEGWTEGRG